MNAQELIQLFNSFSDTYGITKPLPQTYEVDAETYANICQFVFKSKSVLNGQYNTVRIILGKNNGIIFKGVELLLKKEDKS